MFIFIQYPFSMADRTVHQWTRITVPSMHGWGIVCHWSYLWMVACFVRGRHRTSRMISGSNRTSLCLFTPCSRWLIVPSWTVSVYSMVPYINEPGSRYRPCTDVVLSVTDRTYGWVSLARKLRNTSINLYARKLPMERCLRGSSVRYTFSGGSKSSWTVGSFREEFYILREVISVRWYRPSLREKRDIRNADTPWISQGYSMFNGNSWKIIFRNIVGVSMCLGIPKHHRKYHPKWTWFLTLYHNFFWINENIARHIIVLQTSRKPNK